MFDEYKNPEYWQKCRMEPRLSIGEAVGIVCTCAIFPIAMVIASILEA